MADIKVKITPLDGSKEFVINKTKINSLSVLSESTTAPAQFNFGVLSDSGSVSFSDFDLELLNRIVDENYDPIGAFVEVIFNGKVIGRTIISDADYNVSEKSVSMNLEGKERILSQPSKYIFTNYKNLYNGLISILNIMGVPSDKIEEQLSKKIIFGPKENVLTIKNALTSMETPNYYIKESSVLNALNTILQVSSLYLKSDLENFLYIDSSRPKFTSYEKENIIKIEDSRLLTDLSFSLIKKDKTKGVCVNESEFTFDIKTDGMYGSYYPVSTDIITSEFVNQNLSAITDGKRIFEEYPNHEFEVSSTGIYLFGKFYASTPVGGEYVSQSMNGNPYYKSTIKEQNGKRPELFVGESGRFATFEYFKRFMEQNHSVETLNVINDYASTCSWIGHEFFPNGDTEYYFAINIKSLKSEFKDIKFEFGAPIVFKYINRDVSKQLKGESKDAFEISGNSLIDSSATWGGYKTSSFLANSIFNDYKDGVMVGSVDISCEDYYNLSGVKIKNSNSGDILNIGDIITFTRINSMLKREVYWKINSCEFKYDGKPYCSISFYEVKEGGL